MALRCYAQAIRRNVPVTATCLSGAPGHFSTEELSEINDLLILTGSWLLHERVTVPARVLVDRRHSAHPILGKHTKPTKITRILPRAYRAQRRGLEASTHWC